MTCPTCGSRVLAGEPCLVCDRIEHVFNAITDGNADAEYYLHEAAHCLLLFRRFPKSRKDLDAIDPSIDVMSPCDKQMTELRTLALELAGCKMLGAASDPEAHINPVWDGLEQIVHDQVQQGGNVKGLVCLTKMEGVRVLRRVRPSRRLVARYVNFVLRQRAAVGL